MVNNEQIKAIEELTGLKYFKSERIFRDDLQLIWIKIYKQSTDGPYITSRVEIPGTKTCFGIPIKWLSGLAKILEEKDVIKKTN